MIWRIGGGEVSWWDSREVVGKEEGRMDGSERLKHREGHEGRESATRPDGEWMRNREWEWNAGQEKEKYWLSITHASTCTHSHAHTCTQRPYCVLMQFNGALSPGQGECNQFIAMLYTPSLRAEARNWGGACMSKRGGRGREGRGFRTSVSVNLDL